MPKKIVVLRMCLRTIILVSPLLLRPQKKSEFQRQKNLEFQTTDNYLLCTSMWVNYSPVDVFVAFIII